MQNGGACHCLFASVLETITPYAFNLQNVAQLPSSRLKAQAELHKNISNIKTVIHHDIPKIFAWFHLILPYVSRDGMSRFVSVWWQWKYRCVPLLAASIGQLIMEGRFKHDAHDVLRNDPFDTTPPDLSMRRAQGQTFAHWEIAGGVD